MQILLIRHGKAEDQAEFARSGMPDEKRPLTRKGADEMRAVARGLRSLVPRIDVLAASALTRAQQTADALAQSFGDAARDTTDALAPDAPFAAFTAWLRTHDGAGVIAAVGHNPHLSELAAWLSTGARGIDMKKGSAVLLELEGAADPGAAKLLWYRTADQLCD